MSFDGIFTHAMVSELSATLKNGRVAKVHQPYQNEIIVVMRANGKNHRLLLSAHPSYSRIQLTTIPYENPSTPPNFCMMMRKQLDGAVLEDIQQIGNDRIIHFLFKSRDEIGDTQNVRLIVELMGRHSNILLVEQDTSRILDAIKHVPSSQNSYRSIMPGAQYVTPPHQDKWNPFDFPKELLAEKMVHLEELTMQKKIQTIFQGIGNDTAKEILFQNDQESKLADTIEQFTKRVEQDTIQPTLTTLENRKELFTLFPYTSLDGEKHKYPSLSDLLDAFYENKAEKDRVKQQAANLIHLIQTEYQRNKKKLKKLERTLEETEQAESYRIKGEVLTAYLHELEKGQESVVLANFYSEEEPLEIKLDPRKTPSQNAQWYFTKYQKLKNAIHFVTKQITQTNEEIAYLDSVSTQVDLASPRDIADIKDELIQEGYIKQRKKSKKGKKEKKRKVGQPDHYVSSDGTSILVGKNNNQNDQLTMKTARKTDIWLHAKNIPGSHVIIQDRNPSEQTILEAAHIAAYFSKSRLSGQVPVDYVDVKKIRKPNGAKPGFVIYEGQQTVYVTPEKELVEKLKK